MEGWVKKGMDAGGGGGGGAGGGREGWTREVKMKRLSWAGEMRGEDRL